MDKLTTFIDDKEIEIYHVSAITSGYGHKKIIVEINYNGNFKEFNATTNNMPGYDAATDLEGNEKSHALYELIENKIIDDIAEWIQAIDEN